MTTLAAYVIVEIEVVDPAGFEDGGATEVREGDWKPKRIIVLKFASMQRAREWPNSEEYREPREMCHRTAMTNMILVEGT